MNEQQNDLEGKKYRLEILKAVLSVLSPLIVLYVGLQINSKLDEQKIIVQGTQLQQQKIDIMQKIVPQLFDANDIKSLAMMYLLKSIDSSMAGNIEIILIKNYSALKQKNDTVQSNALLNAAESFGGSLADTLKTINRKYQAADSLEKLGYSALTNKNVTEAIKYFDKADKVYPTFRQSFETKNYLNKHKSKLQDTSSIGWKDAFDAIKIPVDLKKQRNKNGKIKEL